MVGREPTWASRDDPGGSVPQPGTLVVKLVDPPPIPVGCSWMLLDIRIETPERIREPGLQQSQRGGTIPSVGMRNSIEIAGEQRGDDIALLKPGSVEIEHRRKLVHTIPIRHHIQILSTADPDPHADILEGRILLSFREIPLAEPIIPPSAEPLRPPAPVA